MRRGTYVRDRTFGNLRCMHGVILHGDSCVQCELAAQTDGGRKAQQIWLGTRPEPSLTGKRGDRIILDDPWAGSPDPAHLRDAVAYFAEALRRRREERFESAMFGVTDPPWEYRGDARPRPEHYNCRSRIDPRWGDGSRLSEDELDLINGRFRGNEIITDPADQRGLSARPVKGRVAA